jgi:hypothetical protein
MPPTARPRRRVRRTAAGLVCVALLGVAACSAGGPERAASSPAHRAAADAAGMPAGADAATVPDIAPALPDQDPRAIVYTGQLTVRVTTVDRAAAAATDAARRAQGTVTGDERTSSGGHAEATLIIRVPSARFTETVAALAGLGTELDRAVTTEDVTEAVTDLDARIATQRASVDRTRQLFGRAQRISDIVLLERELSRREADLAALEARKRGLDNRVALSTITLQLVTAAPAVAERREGFLGGLATGWSAFTTAVTGVLTGIGVAVPFALALALITVPAYVLLRRRRRTVAAAAETG